MDVVNLTRFIFALGTVIALILLISWVTRRLGWDKKWQGMSARDGRLQVIDSVMIDTRHKIVLVRCDASEHMIVVGPHNAAPIATLSEPNHETKGRIS